MASYLASSVDFLYSLIGRFNHRWEVLQWGTDPLYGLTHGRQ